jgi:membrane protein implicated in regulation of membrane protease activity
MAAWLATGWVWIAAGLVIGILEVLIPGYFLFVGFAIGAVLTGVWLGLGLPGAGWMAASPGNALTVFAVLSLMAWLGLRQLMGVRGGQVKRIDRDIND